MKVTITYRDNDSFTVEEVVRQAVHNYGKSAHIEVMPESTQAYDLIYFGLQQLMTHEQLGLIYNSGDSYQQDLKRLRSDILYKLEEIVDQAIIDTESKVA
jgi:SAM-dependent MidA family methyltransferase